MRYLFVLVLLASSAAFPQSSTPVKFRGAYIGEALGDFVDCSQHKPIVIRDGYKMHGKLCDGAKGSVSRMQSHAMSSRKDGEVFMFEDRKLFRIVISIPNDDWDKVRYDLTEKLGEPKSEVPTVYQNGFGAHWEYDRGFWESGDIIASAGVSVAHIGNQAIHRPFSNQPQTQGIQITITDAAHAKLPASSSNSLD